MRLHHSLKIANFSGDLSLVFAVAGANNLTKTGPTAQISRIATATIHPQYSHLLGDLNDIALIKLMVRNFVINPEMRIIS